MNFDFSLNNPDDNPVHHYLKFDEALPKRSDCDRIAAQIVNCFGNSAHSKSILKKSRDLTLTVRDTPQGELRSISLNFEKFSSEVRQRRSIPYKEFALPPPSSPFFDSLLHLSRNFHILHPNHDGAITIKLNTPFGENFPITPSLDREGVAFTSFQPELLKNIKRLFFELVDSSDSLAEIHSKWMNPLRMLLNDCVSLIEITLHQLYFGAKFNYKTNWLFDEKKLGGRHGRRILDKLKWVGAICSKPLGDASSEIAALGQIREIRNHFSHLDPPCIAMTIEEIAGWCNLIPQIASLAAKIRGRFHLLIKHAFSMTSGMKFAFDQPDEKS